MTKKTYLLRLFLFFTFVVTVTIGCDEHNHTIADHTITDETPDVIKLEIERGHQVSSTPIYYAAFSPDSKIVVTLSEDSIVRIWDAVTGKELQKFEHTNWVESATFSSDSKKVITVLNDATIWIWDIVTGEGKKLQELEHVHPVHSAAFSPDGKKVVTASSDDTVWIWDVAMGKELQKFEHTDSVDSAAFSPNGKIVVTASSDNTAWIWDVATGKELQKVTEYFGKTTFSPDGKMVIMLRLSEANSVLICDATMGEELQKLEGHANFIRLAQFSPDSQKVVTASFDNTARIWDVATGKELQKLEGPIMDVSIVDLVEGKAIGVYFATFSPDGQKVVTASFDNTARIWDVATGKELYEFKEHIERVNTAFFSPDGKKLMVRSYDGTVWIWNYDMIRQYLEHKEQRRKKLIADGFTSLLEYQIELKYEMNNLQTRLQKADAFDQHIIKKEITVKQNEIKSKKFFAELPYDVTNIEVDDAISSMEIELPLDYKINKIKNANDPDSNGDYQYQCNVSGKTIKCILREEDNISNIRIIGATEIIKSLVRQKKAYGIIVKFENLCLENGYQAMADILDIQIVK
jgi:WD40 repeat protein